MCLRRALEIWAEGVVEAEGVEGEAEGVGTKTITTISTSTTTIRSNISRSATTKATTGVVLILSEPRLPATQSRLSRSRHSTRHLQELANSIQGHECPMAPVASQWAEGSRRRRHPAYVLLINPELKSHEQLIC